MSEIHKYIGWVIPVGFGVLALWAGLSLIRNRAPAAAFWTLIGAMQAIIAIQVLVGLVLLIIGRAPASDPAWLHYAYGGLFPAALLIAAHRGARRYSDIPWAVFGLASLVICGLTVRALMTGLGV